MKTDGYTSPFSLQRSVEWVGLMWRRDITTLRRLELGEAGQPDVSKPIEKWTFFDETQGSFMRECMRRLVTVFTGEGGEYAFGQAVLNLAGEIRLALVELSILKQLQSVHRDMERELRNVHLRLVFCRTFVTRYSRHLSPEKISHLEFGELPGFFVSEEGRGVWLDNNPAYCSFVGQQLARLSAFTEETFGEEEFDYLLWRAK